MFPISEQTFPKDKPVLLLSCSLIRECYIYWFTAICCFYCEALKLLLLRFVTDSGDINQAQVVV